MGPDGVSNAKLYCCNFFEKDNWKEVAFVKEVNFSMREDDKKKYLEWLQCLNTVSLPMYLLGHIIKHFNFKIIIFSKNKLDEGIQNERRR